MTGIGFLCSCCGNRHDELPFGYGTPAPAFWHEGLEGDPKSLLSGEQCVIDDEHFFLRGRLVLPVVDADDDFEWGMWVSVSRANFARAAQLRDDPARVGEPPYFGWLSTELPLYGLSTLHLKSNLHSQAVGTRPTVELEPTDHPLAVEQRTGITVDRVRTIAERLLHP